MAQQGRARVDQVQVWRTLMEVHAVVLADIADRLAGGHQLSVSEFDTLVNIPPGGVRHQELAERVILSGSALSRLVDRLHARGLVTKDPIPGDQRGVEIRLTETGANVRRAAARTNARAVIASFGCHLTQEQLAALGDILSLVRERHRSTESRGEP